MNYFQFAVIFVLHFFVLLVKTHFPIRLFMPQCYLDNICFFYAGDTSGKKHGRNNSPYTFFVSFKVLDTKSK